MEDIERRLVDAFRRLSLLKSTCSSHLDQQCHLQELTDTQIEYLKVIDQHSEITLSDLALKVHNSKPTVTEMVKRFIELDCVYKRKCSIDGRKAYILLTNRGERIARMEENTVFNMIKAIQKKLNDDEINELIQLLDKIGDE